MSSVTGNNFLIGGDLYKEVQVIILGQDHRPQFVKVTVQVKDDRALGRRHVVAIEFGRQILLEMALPAASLAHRLSPLRLEGADHQVIVIGRHVDRQREPRQHAVGLVPRAKIRRRVSLERVRDPLLRVHLVAAGDGEVLRDAGQVSPIPKWVAMLCGQLFGDVAAEWEGRERGTGAEKRSAPALLDAGEEHFPEGVAQRTLHDRAR